MKPFITLALLTFALFLNPNNCQAQTYDKGDIIVDIYTGYPNLLNLIFKEALNGEENLNINMYGPIGVRGEYLFQDKFGFGLNAHINNFHATYTDGAYDYELNIPIIRIMPKFSYHYSNSATFDGYLGVQSGVVLISPTFDSNDPSYSEEDLGTSLGGTIAFRIETGMRISITEMMAINAELGLGGGSLLAAGLSFRIQ